MKRAVELLDKYNSGKATEEEKALVESWYLKFNTPSSSDLKPEEISEEYELGLRKLSNYTSNKRRLWPRIAVAACILFCMGIVFFNYYNQNETETEKISNHIEPGGDKAILTLSNGKRIDLTGTVSGKVAVEEGVTISKSADGQLVYILSSRDSEKANSYNLIETPKGGRYQIHLPDGTKVWLNAASSLRYPVNFSENQRMVELTGEGYFEVAKDKNKPFKVKTREQVVEVLGTHFNINSYIDESTVKTTLLEGSVKVIHKEKSTVLVPNQQAILGNNNLSFQTIAVDAEEVLSWKNGYLVFEDADIQYIMRNLSRWYNIEVEYQGLITKQKFGGAFHQSANINELLKYLETYGNIRFKINGRRVIVMS